MKTAISIPNQTYEAADGLAKTLGMSRSQLYTTAIERFLELHLAENVTEAINLVCDEADTSLEPGLMALQNHSLEQDDW